VYVFAPLPVKVVDAPAQIVGLDAEAETFGNGFTVTETFAIFAQPVVEFVPVTVYVVVEVGETETEVPLSEPGFHV
jgi:hypothetical protein